jgi:hypothetical protein
LLHVVVGHDAGLLNQQVGVKIERSDIAGCVTTDPTFGQAVSQTKPIQTAMAGEVTYDFPVRALANDCGRDQAVTFKATLFVPAGSSFTARTPDDPTIPEADLLVTAPRPGLEITAPGRSTTLYITPEPMMPQIAASAKITGVTPDPTPTTNFDWTVDIRYKTRQQTPRTLTDLFSAAQVRGGQFPQNIFDVRVRGGDITLSAFAQIVQGSVSNTKEGPIIRGENPLKSDIQTRLNNGDAEQTGWLRKIACQESGQAQFVPTTATPSGYRYPGEPLMSSDGFGGAGIMQITVPQPTFAELWDWRANVDKGKQIFAEKVSGARAYPGDVRTDGDFTTMVNRTNQWRQSQWLEPLEQIIVPDFGWYNVEEPSGTRMLRNLLVEDAVRGYNGWAPKAPAGQFGLGTHEFRLKTRPVEIIINGQRQTVPILEVENEFRTLTGLRAYAIWIRVPLNERGFNNYVENVRNQPPTCP